MHYNIAKYAEIYEFVRYGN